MRYFNNEYKGWILLEKNDYIGLNINKLFIKAYIKTYNVNNLIKSYLESRKRVEKLSNEIQTINTTKTDKGQNSETDIISVLIANPLIDLDEKEEKELKSMNDFNNIASSIFNVIIDSTKLINAEFYPLTEYNLKKAISHKPKILHLICKSTYILPKKEEIKENDESFNFVNLIFEDDAYCTMRKINQIDLDEILEEEEIKNNIKNIFLIISTQLAKDVYKMVEKYDFKNIFVQHTTVANSSFVADFNEHFYKNIIQQMNINIDIVNLYKDERVNDSNQLCCCFHNHKNNCGFKQNFIKELYYNVEDEKDKSNIEKNIPHFSHLRYLCKNKQNCSKEDDFCYHANICNNNPKQYKNICCCFGKKNEKKKKKHPKSKPEQELQHNIQNIFFHNFEKKNNIIKLGNGINSFGVINNSEIVPDYEKMKYIVGRNNIVYEVYQDILNSDLEIINIYNKGKQNELIQLVDIIIEYLKERINNESNNINCSLCDNLEMKKSETFSSITPSKNEILNLNTSKSAPLRSEVKLKYNFIKIILKSNEELNTFKFKEKSKFKNIFFLIVLDDNLIKDLFNKIDKILKNPIFIFSNKLLGDKENEIIKIKNLEIRSLKFEDYQIQYQTEKIKKIEEEFESYIKDEMKGDKALNIKINNESTKKYEILFLFNCIQLEIKKFDLEIMFPDDNEINDIENLIENNLNFIIDKKKETYKKILIYKKFEEYFENYQTKITDTTRQNILLKFMEFYSIVFRYLIENYKDRNNKKNDKNITFYTNSYLAIIELGEWLNLKNKENNPNEKKYIEKIKVKYYKVNKPDDYNKYFNILAENFTKLFTNENIDLYMKNSNIWNKVKNYIEDISISYFSCLGIFDINIDIYRNIFSTFQELFKEKNELIYARLILLRWIHFNSLKVLDELDININIIGEKKCKEEDLANEFAKLIIKTNEYKNIEKNEIINDNFFIDIYKNRVKLVFYKYKIKNGICKNEDLEDLKKLANEFKKENFHYYEIEAILLIAEWYLLKYKNKENIEEDSYNYLNLAIYLSYFYEKVEYDFYSKKEVINVIKNSFKAIKEFKLIKNEEEKEKIIEKLKIICNEYNYEYKNISPEFYCKKK